MDYIGLSCLICLNKYSKFFQLKNHVCTGQHQLKFKAIFQEEQPQPKGKPQRKARLPFIGFLKPECVNQHKVGVSLLTVYYSTKSTTFFYLCHVCEEKCEPDGIVGHLLSANHCTNYFSYADPNSLNFAWMPNLGFNDILRPWLIKELIKKESVTLQFLNVPENLKKKLDECSYSEVMDTLRENDQLLKIIEAAIPQRKMIQTYQKDNNREYHLLGLQHLVECICVGQTDKRYYLCTLCKQTVNTYTIINHVLSFDHIHCYFELWHPSTLLPKEHYTYSSYFVNKMVDLAKQKEDMEGTANAEIEQLTLDPAEFASVNFTCYEEALQKLESITMEKNGSSLFTRMESRNKPKSCSVYKVHCQSCSVLFETESKYMTHLSEHTHTWMWEKLKHAGGSQCYEQKVIVKFSLDLYSYLQESLEQNDPVVGVSLVVACVSSRVQVEPIYICFACQNCFPESFLRQHFKSHKHLILTLLYQNPWRLPFAWKSPLDLKVLKTMAWEEAKARGPDEMILKAFDIPYWVFHCLIPPCYVKVMEKLEKLELFPIHLKNRVPQCETYSKLQQNERFPLLGKQFLVIHACEMMDHASDVGFLCLLCEQTMSDDEFYAHVFSWKHVATFLNRFHPGSLSGSTDTATLLDLAQQAESLHPTSYEQAINLDTPICKPCPYETVIQILAAAKRRHGGGQLKPTITPQHKLFPRQSLQQVGNDTVRDNTQGNTQEKKNEDTIEKVSVEPSSENIKKCSLKSDNNAKDGASKETEACPGEGQSAVKETCQQAKEEIAEVQMKKDLKKEITEELITREHISEFPQRCQNTVSCERVEVGQESSKTSKDVPTPRNIVGSNKGRKRSNGVSDKSPQVTSPGEGMKGKMAPKRQRFNAGEHSSQNIPCGGQTLTTTINQRENMELCQKTAKTQATASSGKTTCKCSSATDGIAKLTAANLGSHANTISAAATKASRTKVTNSVAAMKAKTSVRSGNKRTVKGANANVAPCVCVNHPPAAPLEAPAASVKSGLISPSMEPPLHTHTVKIKPKENRFKVGLYELILVNCEKRRQVYCKLCSKRVNESGHTSTFTHQSNYVNKLYGPSAETSHFEKIIAHLAEAEKYAGTRRDQLNSQSVEVNYDVYKELASIHDDKAIEKLKNIIKQKALQVPSVSTTDHAQMKLQVVDFSPCEISSPDDGICVRLNQTSGLSVTNQPAQENIRVTESACTSELRSNLKEQADRSDGAKSGAEKGPVPSDPTPDQVQPLILKSDPDPVPPPSIQEADTTVTIKQEKFDPFFDAPAHIEVMPTIQRSAAPVEKHQGCAHSVAAHSESAHPALVTSIKQEPLSFDWENELRPIHTEEHAPGPEQHSAPQELPGTSQGDKNQSCMEGQNPEPVIGLGFVWKCRGTAGNSFYLCESCKTTFSTSHIAHASSHFHWYKYMRWQYPSFVEHWKEDYPPHVKMNTLRAAATALSKRESGYALQDVLLRPELYEHVHSAPFSEALQIAQHVKRGENQEQRVNSRPTTVTNQEMVKAGDGGKQRKASTS